MPLLILTLSDNMKRYAMSWGTDEDKFVYVNPVEQSNGNWVIYNHAGTALWSIGWNSGGSVANLVVFFRDGCVNV